ncbi:MAG: hypothetical protein WBX22_11780 [Silvibacterium sp.]
MSQAPEKDNDASENAEHHSNVSDESIASLNTDLEPAAAKQEAESERLKILIQSDVKS